MESPSWLKVILRWDCSQSKRLYLSGWLFERWIEILLKGFEISGHGVPWFILSVCFLLLTSPDGKLPMSTAVQQQNPIWLSSLSISAKYSEACILLFALLFDVVIVGTIKAVVRRRRPAYNKDDMYGTVSVDNFSFPSGHSTRAATLALLLPRLYSMHTWPLMVWSIFMAISRVMLATNTPEFDTTYQFFCQRSLFVIHHDRSTLPSRCAVWVIDWNHKLLLGQ
eukprot:gene8137-10120_t